MNRKLLFSLLGVEFAALIALMLLASGFPALFSALPAFPFEQIGAGLGALALTGNMGNGAALAIWAGISMLPLIPAIKCARDKSRRAEGVALALLSASLCAALFTMANPESLRACFPNIADMSTAKAVVGLVVWSVAVLWGVLRLLRLFRTEDERSLLRYLKALLYALCALFTGAIAVSCGGALINGLSNAQHGLDGAIAFARFLATALPYALDIAITLSALTLIDALCAQDGPRAAELAHKLARLCCVSLGVTAAAIAGLNALQLALARWLTAVAVTADIPVMSLAFVLAALLGARLIAENHRLKDDNALFI
ncbi:MAG: hypothetical protein Q4B99_00200 [Clostridia bacterium]|nr:hypothetical protein [Clostridia bacterium]